MSKRVYISADYSMNSGDRDVVEILNKWGEDEKHKTDFIDTSKVASGSVADEPDCRICDLKREFNNQINASSAVIFIVGDKTASRTAGSNCFRANKPQEECECTPYKQNTNGTKPCKVSSTTSSVGSNVGSINSYSYLKHEFMQAKKCNKKIIILYNSLRKEADWLPTYMKDFEDIAHPFWIKNETGEKIGDYNFIKEELGFD